jgi:hypothetical protein
MRPLRVEREVAERLVGSLLHLSWIGGRKQPAGVDQDHCVPKPARCSSAFSAK